MGQRPAHIRPPAYLSKSPPVPEPDAPEHVVARRETEEAESQSGRLDPTRYGDWEKKGIAIDF